MRRSMRVVLVSLLFSLGCSHATDDRSPPSGAGSASSPIVAAPNAPAQKSADDLEQKPAEPFTDAQRTFASVKDALAKGYYDPSITEDDLYRAAVQGMLEHADPRMKKWNKLLTPAELAEMHNDLKGEIVGVGVNIKYDPETGRSTVLGTLPGSPAERAGLVAGDEIVSIDGKLYKGSSLRQVVRDIRGKSGETVAFSLLRGDKIVTASMKREIVAYDEVVEMALPDDVGYVRVRGFSQKTAGALKTALEAIGKRGSKSVVLDLRSNPGGSFDAAVAVAELFLPTGANIASVKRRDTTESIVSKGAPALAISVPMTVLINHDTSSGAELVTAALREGRKALVVGSPTLGKWTVQKLDELGNGYGFKYTVGLFLSPSGKTYEGTGLPPDVEVDMDGKQCEQAMLVRDPAKRLAIDVQLRTAVGVLRAR